MTPLEAASYWFVRQDAQAMTPGDHDEFEHWLLADAANRDAYQRTAAMWQGIESTVESGELRALRVAALAAGPEPKVWPRAVAVAGGTLAAVVAIAALTWNLAVGVRDQMATPDFASAGQYMTGQKQQSSVALPDGSQVAMNLDTDFRIDFTPQRREVRLLKGQAFFEVAKDPKRPFVVIAADRRIEALGTKFDVKLSDQRLEVVLLEGRVSVERDERSLLEKITKRTERVELRPDQRLVAAPGESASIGATKAAQATSWHEGWIAFEDESLERAIAELNRYSEVPLVIADDAARAMRVSGVFRIGQPDRFAAIIQELLPLTVRRGEHGEMVLALKPDGEAAR